MPYVTTHRAFSPGELALLRPYPGLPRLWTQHVAVRLCPGTDPGLCMLSSPLCCHIMLCPIEKKSLFTLVPW